MFFLLSKKSAVVISLLSFLYSCQQKVAAPLVYPNPEQDVFEEKVAAISNFYDENALKSSAYFDSSLAIINSFADTTLVRSWVVIVGEFKIDPDVSFQGEKFIEVDLSLDNPKHRGISFMSETYVPKDSAKSNFLYNRLKNLNLKKGDTVLIDGLFELVSNKDRSLYGGYIQKFNERSDFYAPRFKLIISSIRAYGAKERPELQVAKIMTSYAYQVAKLVSNNEEVSDSIKQKLNKFEDYCKANLSEEERAEVSYLASRRALREINLIK